MSGLVLVSWMAVAAAFPQTTPEPVAVGRVVELAVAKSIAAENQVSLQITVGALRKGTEVEVRAEDGRLLGVISPFGSRPAQPKDRSTYTIPVPRDVVKKGRLSVRLILNAPDHSKRAPTQSEVSKVQVSVH
jgi:hypothetical protein